MTILDCVVSGKIYKSKILHELWAFMQTYPRLHILYKWAKWTSCDDRNFIKFRPDTFILGTYTAQCMYTMKIISVFHKTNIVIFWQLSPTSSP